ncbi:spore coat associated protein CotJA [Blautia faecis]|nr:spore coat associated protein CotJA [Blautia faecis]NSG92079.1 spore coat associated protein CotJA [Blautia faecis]NSJ71236.1 spore coat associated protein CotJA [Blautia faecis]
MYEHLKHLAPAMAYVPYQNFTSAYDLDYALSVGTIFPQLCKPFCGKRGIRR